MRPTRENVFTLCDIKKQKIKQIYTFSRRKLAPFFHLHDREKARIPRGWLLLLLYCVIAFEYTSVCSNAARETFFIYARLSTAATALRPPPDTITPLLSGSSHSTAVLHVSHAHPLRPSIEFFTSRQHVTPFLFFIFLIPMHARAFVRVWSERRLLLLLSFFSDLVVNFIIIIIRLRR